MKKWILVMMVACFLGTPLSAEELFSATKAGDLSDMTHLGGALYRDLTLSFNANEACMTCHHPSAGFADQADRIDPVNLPVSAGSVAGMFGGRNAPSSAYAGFAPCFYYDADEGLFLGGAFWDGRATGNLSLGGALAVHDPLAEQAMGPFLNPVEMAVPDAEMLVALVKNSAYADLFLKVFGPEAFDDTQLAYEYIGIAIADFEHSHFINRFSSKFDKFVAEQGGEVDDFGVEVEDSGFRKYVGPPKKFKSKYLTYDEADGLALFNADSGVQLENDGSSVGGMCYLCHLTENGPEANAPLLTDFSYDNLGIPKNDRIEALAGFQETDYGLGARVEQLETACPECAFTYNENETVIEEEAGKFKVPTLRNVERSAPYGHNGYFPDLLSIVHFYNVRNSMTEIAAEVPSTVNEEELGNLGLSPDQEAKIVLFLKTLTDR